jgi:hypothetical protein
VQTGHAAAVAKQQTNDRLARSGVKLTWRQRAVLAALIILPLPWLFFQLSERDSVSQMIALSNGGAILALLLALWWAALRSIRQLRKVRLKIMQSQPPVRSDILMSVGLSVFLLTLICLLPLLLTSCFVTTLASIFYPNQIALLDPMKNAATMLQPVVVLLALVSASMVLTSIRIERSASLRKWRLASNPSLRSGAKP